MIAGPLHAYVLTKNLDFQPLRWPSQKQNLIFYVNPHNSSGMLSSDVYRVINESLEQWDQASSLSFEMRTTDASSPRAGRNNIIFSRDPMYFSGSGVAGITMTTSRQGTGEIVEADILINDRYQFTASSSDKLERNYLGNVIVHELGHAIGLDHSQTYRTSMFFEMLRNQHRLHSDDIAGAQAHYPSIPNLGEIRGEIIGSNQLRPIFGAYVEAISEKTGKVVAGSLSHADGRFVIKGLNRNDRYIIKVSPVRHTAALPEVYGDIKTDFCHSREDFRASFFETCRVSDEGRPQIISLNNSSNGAVHIGKVSIGCGVSSPYDYRINKGGEGFSINLRGPNHSWGDRFVGFFRSSDLENEIEDRININLRNFPIENYPGAEFRLRVLVTTQDLFSPITLRAEVSRPSGSVIEAPVSTNWEGVHFDADGLANTQLDFDIPLSSDSELNEFDLNLFPQELRSFADERVSVSRLDYLPSVETYLDRQHFYVATFQMIKVENGLRTHYSPLLTSNSDNAQCPSAPEAYAVTPRAYLADIQNDFRTAQSQVSAQTDFPLACGTILLKSGRTPPGPGGLSIIAFMPFFLIIFIRKFKRFNIMKPFTDCTLKW